VSISRQMEQVGSREGGEGVEPYDVQRPAAEKRLRSWVIVIGRAVPELRVG
jgi:hypothetical protein